MSIAANYNFRDSEEKWYQYWLDRKIFASVPDERKSYTIVIPPPNVTGVLHMGHMLNNTLQDVLIRRARMRGFNACWVPGTDHASIATEAKVVAKLKEEGIAKSDISREEFLEHAWAWTHKHGGIILDQLKKLGCSCDWDRTAFTMDEVRSESVIKVFIDLYKRGKIYRGYRMVNWDPEARTTVSDEEVVHKEVNAKLYFIKYPIENEKGFAVIATTRPETILGDVAVCVNPADERHFNLKDKRLLVPIADRAIPVIEDSYVSTEFGTGCLKVTPAHDINDKEIGERHGLPIIDILNEDGTLNQHGLHYAGMDRFAVRKQIVEELQQKGFIEKIEDYKTAVGTSERTGAVIEPRLSVQWFLRMKEIAQPALEAVMTDEVELIPAKFKNTYRHWMENVHDWCISRQLYWGHQIPAWYYGEGMTDYVIAATAEEAAVLATESCGRQVTASELRQDGDTLDTWFSSWLWPLSVFDGIRHPENEEINYYYPTRDLVTAPEILFFWVARMIIAGYEFQGKKPFDKVYLTGIVRDKQGRKMSKSLGNSPDPFELMQKYSTDGVRVGMLLTSPAGNDLPFDEELCQQGRNFGNKIWNAYRLTRSWETEAGEADEASRSAMMWFENRLRAAIAEIDQAFEQYRLSEALMLTYKLVWDDFCSWYLEAVKPAFGEKIKNEVLQKTMLYFEELCLLLHPFMPFITEELWQAMAERQAGESICLASWPGGAPADADLLREFEQVREVISGVRNIRAEKNIPYRDALALYIPSEESVSAQFLPLLQKMANLSDISKQTASGIPGFSFLAGAWEFFIPAGEDIDLEAERNKLQKELEYQEGFLISVSKKLENERFVNHAPAAVVEGERRKKADAEAKISSLQQRIAQLN